MFTCIGVRRLAGGRVYSIVYKKCAFRWLMLHNCITVHGAKT